MEWTKAVGFFRVFFVVFFSSLLCSRSHKALRVSQISRAAHPPQVLPSCLPYKGEPLWLQPDLGGRPPQSRQQALLRQVSLQGVEYGELLIWSEGQELLDHLGGVGAPDGRQRGHQIHIPQNPSSTQRLTNHSLTTTVTRQCCLEGFSFKREGSPFLSTAQQVILSLRTFAAGGYKEMYVVETLLGIIKLRFLNMSNGVRATGKQKKHMRKCVKDEFNCVYQLWPKL